MCYEDAVYSYIKTRKKNQNNTNHNSIYCHFCSSSTMEETVQL